MTATVLTAEQADDIARTECGHPGCDWVLMHADDYGRMTYWNARTGQILSETPPEIARGRAPLTLLTPTQANAFEDIRRCKLPNPDYGEEVDAIISRANADLSAEIALARTI